MAGISAIVITLNEERNIGDCLESLKWCDEIIVVDSGSSDRTIEISKNYRARIIQAGSNAFGMKRNIGFENASKEWLLWLDADERITDELRQEIVSSVSAAGPDVFLVNRRSFFVNKFIRHSGWYPDYTLRLFKRTLGLRFDESPVHEKIVYKGKIGKLKSEILHYTDRDFEHYLAKLNLYTTLDARRMFEKGLKASLFDIIFRPVFTFFKMYFLRLGFLDGFTGLVLCSLSGVHVLFKYSKLYYLTKKR